MARTDAPHRSSRTPRGLGFASAVFFALALVFAVGNFVVVRTLVYRVASFSAGVESVNRLRQLGPLIAVQAMRLTDGAYIQTAQLSRNIDTFERTLQALGRGGVVEGLEVGPLRTPEMRNSLTEVAQAWETFRSRVQAVLLDSYSRGAHADDPEQQNRQAVLRQWIADDAAGVRGATVTLSHQAGDIVDSQYQQARNFALVLLLVDAVLLLLGYMAVRHWVLRPLRALHRASHELVVGNYGARIDYDGPWELGSAATAFNLSMQRIQGLLEAARVDRIDLERSDTIFRGLAVNSMVGIYLAQDDRFSFVSPKMAEIFGYPATEMIETLPVLGIIAPRERYLVAELVKASLGRKDGTMRYERHGRRKDGTQIDIEVFSSSVNVEGQVAIIGIVQDITERKKAESSAQLATIAYENSSEAIAVTDPAGVVIDVNPAFSRITGYWEDEIRGEVLPLLRPGRHNVDFFDAMWHAINTTGRWEGEYWSRRKSGDDYAERVIVDTAWNHDGSVNCRVAMLGDVTAKKQIEADVWGQAYHDPLTGLPNRQYFSERLEQALRNCEGEQQLALLFLDLDLFKEINDSMGHAIGDLLLVEVAQRLRECVPSCGFVSRQGGDEFTLIIEGIGGRSQLDELAADVIRSIRRPYYLNGELVHISVSIGAAMYPQDAVDQDTLLRHVDLAMYAAKDAGRDRYCYFDQSMHERAQMHQDLLRGLSMALSDEQFFLLYQPIYSMHTGRIVKAEALLRWNHPKFGVVQPVEFIPFAEDRQLINRLGDWVMMRAAAQLAQWRQTCKTGMQVTVNVSLTQLAAGAADPGRWLGQLQALGLQPDSIMLELTERSLTGRSRAGVDDGAVQILQGLRQVGMRIGLDDFGVGMSSLSFMGALPIDYIKLDSVFTQHIVADSNALMVCEAIILLAHKLGLKVIAEGVTTAEQHELLCQAGCDSGQGYWYSAPVEPAMLQLKLESGEGIPEGETA